MSKEMIISVNGREKKIAIIENGKVSEFYIERGEGGQGGIVGNIYKGRVMRVLPGMQSAFVDIGLERDAFLYVSDFFDEEEEFERIVINKTKAPTVVDKPIEHKEAARGDLEQPSSEIDEISEDDVITSEREPEYEKLETVSMEEDNVRGGRRRKRRKRGGREIESTVAPEDVEEVSEQGEVSSYILEDQRMETPFVVNNDFQRIIDEEERAVEYGEMLKDAMLQERIFDRIHAVEFDMADTARPPETINSLIQTNSLERIDDDSDVTSSIEDRVHKTVAAHIDSFIDEVKDEQMGLVNTTNSLERISDDDATEAEAIVPGATKTETSKSRGRRGTRGSKAEQQTSQFQEPTEKPKRSRTSSKGKTTKSASKGRGSKRKAATDTGNVEASDELDTQAALNTNSEAVSLEDNVSLQSSESRDTTNSDNASLEDAEASVTASHYRAEFATRRGGRRRRRKHTENPQNQEEKSTSNAVEAEIAVEAVPRPTNGRGNGSNRGPRREREREKDKLPSPTITDLLREGQEILVQIAKEPISQKGARITSHIALPGRYLVYMPTIEHVGVSRKIESDSERARLRKLIQLIRAEEDVPSGGFIVRTAGMGISEEDLRDDARYLVRTWLDIRRTAEKVKAPALAHRDLDLIQRILRDQLSNEFTAIRVDAEDEYLRIVEFINRIQPRLVNRVKLYTRDEPILEAYGVQAEIDKAVKPRVWLRSGGYLVINQTEALVAIDVNTGKFVGRGGSRLEDTITKTNLEAVDEIVRQIRLRDLGGIIVLDLIDMEEKRNRQKVMQALQEALQHDKSPTKVLSFNDFGLVIMTRKRVKQSLERTLCSPCPYCQGAGLVKSAQTICYEVLEEARRLSNGIDRESVKQTTLRVNPEIARALHTSEQDVLTEIEDYLGSVDLTSDEHIHQEQFDFAFS
jgi:ribonuclease G